MNKFWDPLIRPIIEKINSKYIVEIGSESGINTLNILEYCQDHDAQMTAIDPFPLFDIEEFKNKYHNQFEIYKGLSLSILPILKNYDAILIDGDHNWYTVYNELKIIEKSFKGKKFPLVFLHDVGWLYGRRDLYYNPENIPKYFMHPYKQLGLYPGHLNLEKKGGLNHNLNNSIYENNPKNGVLTAVEDFIDESDLEFCLNVIDVFHGLGILYQKDEKIVDIINNCVKEANFLKLIENERIILTIENLDLEKRNYFFERDLNENKRKMGQLKSKLKGLDEELRLKDVEIGEFKDRLRVLDEELRLKDVEIGEFKDRLRVLDEELKRNAVNIAKIKQDCESLENLKIKISNLRMVLYELDYFNNHKRSLTQRLISKFPYIYMFLKSDGKRLKDKFTTIKGYYSIKRKGLIDIGYYLKDNPDVRLSGFDPILHYIYYGYNENRNPNPFFDVEYYLSQNGDIRNSKVNPLVHYSLYGENGLKNQKILVSVVLTSYNHEKYIKQCIDSILMQKGDFDLEIIIGDDCSEDNTRKILEEYQSKHTQIITLLHSPQNLGVTKNLKRCFKAASGKYVAICEGDDYWTDPNKLNKQINFLEKRKDYSMCFHSILLSYETNHEKNRILQENINKDTFTTSDLILDYMIGNFSCCMYRNEVVKKLPDGLYDLFTVDWMFNIACSEHGKVGFLKEPMSVYRIHNKGLWSGKESDEKIKDLLELIDIYNEFLDYRHNSEFVQYKKMILKSAESPNIK